MDSTDHVVQIRAELGNAVLVRPGDKLVLGYAGPLTAKEAHTIKERLAEKLPGVEAVLCDQLVAMAVYRDESVRKISYPLSDDEVQSMREQGIIDADGKTTADRIMEQLPDITSDRPIRIPGR